jgi:N-acetylneuraminate synthase
MIQFPYIIAEMSGNHNQSIERAKTIILAAKNAGASAVKLQTYTPDTITLNHDSDDFVIKDKNSLWSSKKLYDLYAEAMTPWEWHKELFDYAAEIGIEIFSSPFDETAVDFLETLNVSRYKIASFENNHIPLIRKIAQTGKPVIISSGATEISQLETAVETLKAHGCNDITVLKCTSTYPASEENSNLVTIPVFKEKFNCTVGLSDHTMGIGVSIAAIALGAEVIEKHLTLDRSEGGVDSAFSMEPAEFKQLVEECNRAYKSLGKVQLDVLPEEEKSLQFKRSIYFQADINAGEIITEKHVKIVRPSKGLAPVHWDDILGKKVSKDKFFGEPLSWDDIA